MALPKLINIANSSTWTAEKARFLPVHSPIKPNQKRQKAGGGQVKVLDLGDAEQFYDIVFLRVSETNRNDLLTFLQRSDVNYSEFTCTWKDESSTSFIVRVWNTTIDIVNVKGGALYNIRLKLRAEIT